MNAQAAPPVSIDALEKGTLDAATFDHAAHVYAAWLYLEEFPLADAIARFSAALRRLTATLGVPGKYHETVTWFFMLLIAERRAAGDLDDWFAFRRNNADLFGNAGDVIGRYYSSELLASERARRSFVLPDRFAA